MESEFVSVQGAALIYEDESVKGDHLALIYVTGMDALASTVLVELRMKQREFQGWL